MRVDRLSMEVTMRSASYHVHVTSWDGVKGKLTFHGNYEHLSLGEMQQVVEAVAHTLRPGTEFMVTGEHIVVQSPLFD